MMFCPLLFHLAKEKKTQQDYYFTCGNIKCSQDNECLNIKFKVHVKTVMPVEKRNVAIEYFIHCMHKVKTWVKKKNQRRMMIERKRK